MRRFPAVLLSLAVSLPLLAGIQHSDPQDATDRLAARGRAVILQTAQPLTTEDRAALAEEGIFIRDVVAGGRYLARVQEGVAATDARIVSMQPLTAEMKIAPSAYREAGRGRAFSELNVVFHREVDFEAARDAIAAAGGTLVRPLTTGFSPSQRLVAKFPSVALGAIAADDRVLGVSGVRRWRKQSDNSRTALASHVTELYSAPYDLTGEGVTVSLFELGAADPTHVEFGGRLTVVPFNGSSGDRSHATHVAGTIGAAGVNPRAKGMAPRVRLEERCVEASNGCPKDWLDDKRDGLAPLGVLVDNNSWGFILGWSDDDYPVWNNSDEYFGAYDLTFGAPIDEISIDKGILFIHSAGNDGNQPSLGQWGEHRHVNDDFETIKDKLFCYSLNSSGSDCPTACTGGCETAKHHTLTPYDTQGLTASAKNVLSVGAVRVNDANGAISIANFSSRGPAKDGRVKPDVVARGQAVFSTLPNGSYGENSGTSMAAPAVTGMAALLVEQWRRTFHGANPKPEQLKALLIAGADDLGEVGPDYTFGFGLVNAKNSVDTIIADGSTGRRIHNLTLAQGQSQEIAVVVPQTQTLRVVMNWADPAIPFTGGSDIAEKALVNDLDLKVIDPSGATHLPYVLDRNSPTAAATRGVNSIDNVEMVEIPNAAAGTYRVIASGTAVTKGPQSAVIVSSVATFQCNDLQEASSNNTAETAYGELVTGQTVNAGVCTPGDIDFYKFTATKPGPVSVTITAGGTPVRALLTGIGVEETLVVPAGVTATLSANAAFAPLPLLLRVEPFGGIGGDAQYTFVPQFGTSVKPRRRAVR